MKLKYETVGTYSVTNCPMYKREGLSIIQVGSFACTTECNCFISMDYDKKEIDCKMEGKLGQRIRWDK